MFVCIIDEAIRSIRERERENKMKERRMMKYEEDGLEKRKYSSQFIPYGGNLSRMFFVSKDSMLEYRFWSRM